MNAQVKDQINSLQIDDSVMLSLEHHEGSGMRILVLPVSRPTDPALRAIHTLPFRPASDPDDDLANATWEDAEWQ